MTMQLIRGNEAVAIGALLGGATHFYGYPITPASEIAQAAALHFPRAGRVFLQAESEVSAINMIYGSACTGARTMTATSGPGISLMAEGISYMAGAELPCVIVNVQRAGPGLGNIWPEQGDYNCTVKGGGHGNYKNFVFAPNSVQEMCDFTYRAFEIADRYRMTVMILADAYIGQMMEPMTVPAKVRHAKRMDWALYADRQSRKNLVTSIYMDQQVLSDLNQKLREKYRSLQENHVEYEEISCKDAEVILVGFGIMSRICFSTLWRLRESGIKAGLFRPKTLFPFPEKRLGELAQNSRKLVVAEMNDGQMAEDVERIAAGRCPVLRYNWFGGIVPTISEIIERVKVDLATP